MREQYEEDIKYILRDKGFYKKHAAGIKIGINYQNELWDKKIWDKIKGEVKFDEQYSAQKARDLKKFLSLS